MSKTVKFEEAFNRLEEIARQLEGGELALEESLALYEEGMKLVELCSQKLDAAEKKILKLSKSGEGAFRTEEMDFPGEEG